MFLVKTSSLFLFGSKYSWIFPSTKEEMNDARRQPGRYHLMSKEFKQLIQEKYEKGQVFFLKKEELEYSWVQYETCFGVPDFQNQTRQQLK